jgi:rhizosphere induced protein
MEEMEEDLQSAQQEYIVNFSNHSGKSGTVCIYLDTQGYPDVQAIAWLTERVTPTTGAQFDWFSDYSFIWGRSRYLVRGSTFYPEQSVDCRSKNQITLDRGVDKFSFFFKDQRKDQSSDFSIYTTPKILQNEVAVGIAVHGRAQQVIKVQPNRKYVFNPRQDYWIAFGDFHEGEPLDMQNIKTCARINFGQNIFRLRVILHSNDSWDVYPA